MGVTAPGAGSFLTLCGVWAAALASPGPDFFLVLQRGVANGARGAFAAAVGVVVGIEAWILVTLVGLGAVLARFPQTRAALAVLGGLYVLSLGWRSITAAKAPVGQGAPRPGRVVRGSDFASGLMTNLANPKALIFFGTLLVRFVPEGGGFGAGFAVWSVMTVMACAWFGLLALAASHGKLRDSLSAKLRLVDFATGAVFIALGAAMVCEGVL